MVTFDKKGGVVSKKWGSIQRKTGFFGREVKAKSRGEIGRICSAIARSWLCQSSPALFYIKYSLKNTVWLD